MPVEEIPTLLTQGTLWRIQILYNLLSDYEILRIRIILFFDCLTCNRFRYRRIPFFLPRPYSILQKDELISPMGGLGSIAFIKERHKIKRTYRSLQVDSNRNIVDHLFN